MADALWVKLPGSQPIYFGRQLKSYLFLRISMTSKTYYIGYYTGRIITRTLIYYSVAKSTVSACKFVKGAARAYKIDANNPDVVTKNVFDCLKYIDSD